jgi:soluble cytochrome b562
MITEEKLNTLVSNAKIILANLESKSDVMCNTAVTSSKDFDDWIEKKIMINTMLQTLQFVQTGKINDEEKEIKELTNNA